MDGSPCKSRKTHALVPASCFCCPITFHKSGADRGCASAADPGGNRCACRLQAPGDSTGGRACQPGGLCLAGGRMAAPPGGHSRWLPRSLEVLLVFTIFARHTPQSRLFVRFLGVFFLSPCCVVSSVLSPKQQGFCRFAPPLVGLSVMNKGTDFYVSWLRVCCSMVLISILPRSAAFRVFCIASSLYSSLADFCSG